MTNQTGLIVHFRDAICISLWATGFAIAFIPALFVAGIVDAYRTAYYMHQWIKP